MAKFSNITEQKHVVLKAEGKKQRWKINLEMIDMMRKRRKGRSGDVQDLELTYNP